MKLPFISCIILIVLSGLGAAFSGSGSGTGGDPYQITDCYELQEMLNESNMTFVLNHDIDCTMTPSWNGGYGFHGVSFSGVLDGQGHVVDGLYNYGGMWWDGYFIGYYAAGLFTFNYGIVKNLGLTNVDIEGWVYSEGGIAGGNSGTIDNCYTTGHIKAGGTDWVGGISGTNSGHIVNSWSNATIEEISGVSWHCGGIVGQSSLTGIVNKSYFTGYVSCSQRTGGIVGYGSGTIIDCYNLGTVAGQIGEAGGIEGYVTSNTFVTNSYNAGPISGMYDTGGLIGYPIATATVNSSYYMSGGGWYGSYLNPTNAVRQSSYVGWDFTNVWRINEGVSYPNFADQCDIDSECGTCMKCIAHSCLYQTFGEDLKSECPASYCDGVGACVPNNPPVVDYATATFDPDTFDTNLTCSVHDDEDNITILHDVYMDGTLYSTGGTSFSPGRQNASVSIIIYGTTAEDHLWKISCAGYTDSNNVTGDWLNSSEINVTNLCGNGVVDGGEACDRGVLNGPCPSTCSVHCTRNSCGGGGGGGFPEEPIIEVPGTPGPILEPSPIFDIPILEPIIDIITNPPIDFRGLFAGFSLAFEKLFTTPLEAIILMGTTASNHWLAIAILIAVLAGVITLARKGKKKGKRRRR
jgi:hypothetical protein